MGELLPDGVIAVRDVVHTRLEGFRPLALDLYLPGSSQDAGAQAVCIYIHGGGWRIGSRREGPGPLSPTSQRLFGRMAQAGLAVAAVDYRLSGEAHFPAQPDDVRAACRWLLDHDDSPVRGLPLTFFGVSAGGQIAALCGLDRTLPVRAVALWYAPTDLVALVNDIEEAGGQPDRGAGSREAHMLGASASEAPYLARDASPVNHVCPGAPPFLLVHGEADRAIPVRQSRRLHEALLAAGASSTFEPVPGYDHMFAGMPDPDVDRLVDRTMSFLLEAAQAARARD